jgi:hypothetical protein
MSSANPLCGAPGRSSWESRSAKPRLPRLWCEGERHPTSRSFPRNQAAGIAAIDMFVVASPSFRLLYVMIILAHDRRKIVRFDVTVHPTASWLSRQVTEAFPWDTAPRYLLRPISLALAANAASARHRFTKTMTNAVAANGSQSFRTFFVFIFVFCRRRLEGRTH